MREQKKGILVVSFGTSHPDTRKKTIDRIKEEIGRSYPQYRVYEAWTSHMIRKKLRERDGILIDSVQEAFLRMKAEGIREVIVQPTHMINGIENDRMAEEVCSFAGDFESIRTGTPVLTSEEDHIEIIKAVMEEWKDLPEKEALVFMGHGTTHYANSVYAALDYRFKDEGYPNVFLGTVEAYPSMESLMRKVKDYRPARVHLAPFMIVAGEHAKNDMAGDREDSWACQFQKAGFQISCSMKGLGEYEGVQKILVRHVGEAK